MAGLPTLLPLVGRNREFATLLRHLSAASAGDGKVVLVTGEPGVGKSRLVQELVERASDTGWQVLVGHAYEIDGSPPYLPITAALQGYVRSRSPEELRLQFGSDNAAVAFLLSEVGSNLPEALASLARQPGERRYLLFESITAFLLTIARAASPGLLLLIEDLQWADEPTLLLLAHLARQLAGQPLLLLATYRSGDTKSRPPLAGILAELSRSELHERISLMPLSLENVAALVEQTFGLPVSQAAIGALYQKTEGNPFFLREMLRQLRTEDRDLNNTRDAFIDLGIPEGVRQVISRRVSRLSVPAQRLLQACAVLGDGVSFDVLVAVADVDEVMLLDALDEAVEAGLIREEGEGYVLAHALIRETLVEGLRHPRKQRLHLRAAEAIENVYTRNLSPHLAALAHHYRLAGIVGAFGKALNYSERAGEAAASLCAYEEAARHFRNALATLVDLHDEVSIERRAGLLQRLGTLVYESGLDWAKGVTYVEEALRFYERLDRPPQATLARIQLGQYSSGMAATLDINRALHHFRAAEKDLAGLPVGAQHGALYHGLAVAAFRGVQIREGLSAAQRARAISAELHDDGLSARAAPLIAFHLLGSGRLADGFAEFVRAREEAARLNQVFLWYQIAVFGGDWKRILDVPREAQAWYRQYLPELERNHAPPGFLGNVRARLGEACVAAGELMEARRLLAQVDLLRNAPASTTLAARLAIAAGDWQLAEDLAGEVHEQCQRTGNRYDDWHALYLLGWLHRLRNNYERADDFLQEALAIGISGGHRAFELTARTELAILYVDTKERAEAEQQLSHCRTIVAGDEDWGGLVGRAALAEAVAEGVYGSHHRAQSHFEQALKVFREQGLVWDESEALARWGRYLFAAGETHSGRAAIAGALAIYERLGAGQGWTEPLLAMQTGSLSRRSAAPAIPDDLTRREMDVLILLAAGNSNREIAEALVLSHRTIERHLAGIYRKIGARGRTEAVSYAVRHGLDESPVPGRG